MTIGAQILLISSASLPIMDQDGTNADEGENMEIEPENFIVNDEILDSHSYGVNKVIPCELCQQMFTNKVS